MAAVQFPANNHQNYHAHVYFDASTVDFARELCDEAGSLFGIGVGRVHQKPVGPHPEWSCQLAFDSSQFDEIILWLNSHRKGLTVLIHGLSGNDLDDHTIYASWLGKEATLDLSQFM